MAIDTPYSDIIAHNRGWTEALLADLNSHSTKRLDYIGDMASTLQRLIASGAEITIWPDYDVDGIASGTVLYAGLAELGAQINMVVPDYRGERDLTQRDVDWIMGTYPHTQAIITCDGGINSNDGLTYAKQHYGLTTLVTDHHIEQDPGCVADVAVNPNLQRSTYDHRDICGAQVAYLVLECYAHMYQPDKVDAIELLRLFAGIGSLADVMPMTHRSRSDVRSALTYSTMLVPEFPRDHFQRIDTSAANQATPLNSVLINLLEAHPHHPYFKEAFQGMAHLLNELGFAGKLYDVDNFDESFIGFTIAPMFNATRRIEADMRLNMAVFTPSVVDKHDSYCGSHNIDVGDELTPGQAVRELIANNEFRRQEVKRHLGNLHPEQQPYAPYVFIANEYIGADESVPAGFLGLLASEMLKSTSGPAAIVLNKTTDDAGNVVFNGSGRSLGDVDLLNLHIDGVSGAGHAQACGIRVTNTSQHDAYAVLTELAAALSLYHVPVSAQEPISQRADLALLDVVKADNKVRNAHHDLLDVDKVIDLVDDLAVMRPFGQGFTYPTITVTVDPAQCRLSTMGRDKRHMKVITPSGLVAIKWNTRDTNADEPFIHATSGELLELTVTFGINIFRENVTAQAIIQDINHA